MMLQPFIEGLQLKLSSKGRSSVWQAAFLVLVAEIIGCCLDVSGYSSISHAIKTADAR
jgi:hypothetical protein